MTNDNDVAQVGDYACNFCDWKSTDTSRPLSRGSKVGCPACEREARFVGSHVAQPAGAGVERIYMSQTCSGYSHERETAHDIEYIRADLTRTLADVQQRARRAAREWMNTHHAAFETNQKREEALADIIAAEFGGGIGHNDAGHHD